jgi:hypothetical protein
LFGGVVAFEAEEFPALGVVLLGEEGGGAVEFDGLEGLGVDSVAGAVEASQVVGAVVVAGVLDGAVLLGRAGFGLVSPHRHDVFVIVLENAGKD